MLNAAGAAKEWRLCLEVAQVCNQAFGGERKIQRSFENGTEGTRFLYFPIKRKGITSRQVVDPSRSGKLEQRGARYDSWPPAVVANEYSTSRLGCQGSGEHLPTTEPPLAEPPRNDDERSGVAHGCNRVTEALTGGDIHLSTKRKHLQALSSRDLSSRQQEQRVPRLVSRHKGGRLSRLRERPPSWAKAPNGVSLKPCKGALLRRISEPQTADAVRSPSILYRRPEIYSGTVKEMPGIKAGVEMDMRVQQDRSRCTQYSLGADVEPRSGLNSGTADVNLEPGQSS